jgi:hypothetical protein
MLIKKKMITSSTVGRPRLREGKRGRDACSLLSQLGVEPHSVARLPLSAVRILPFDLEALLDLQSRTERQRGEISGREEVGAGPVLAHIEVLFDLGTFPEPQLSFVEAVSSEEERGRAGRDGEGQDRPRTRGRGSPSIVSEENLAPWLEGGGELQ